jgi:hypothetical protein
MVRVSNAKFPASNPWPVEPGLMNMGTGGGGGALEPPLPARLLFELTFTTTICFCFLVLFFTLLRLVGIIIPRYLIC